MRSLLTEPWFADGLNEEERYLVRHGPAPWGWSLSDNEASVVIAALLEEPWIQDGLNDVESSLILGLGPLEDERSVEALLEAINALSREPWVADGLGDDESFVVGLLSASAIEEDITGGVQAITALLDEPWFQDGLDEGERSALWHLQRTFSGAQSVRNAAALLSRP